MRDDGQYASDDLLGRIGAALQECGARVSSNGGSSATPMARCRRTWPARAHPSSSEDHPDVAR
jgi:hypothetical protein